MPDVRQTPVVVWTDKVARKPSRTPPAEPPDWVGWGGWHARFARVVVEVVNGRFAFALIDSNGDGRELSAQVAARDDTGTWRLAEEDNDSAAVGPWWTPAVVCTWGHASPRATVVLDYAGEQHVIRADRSGWWAFVHPCDPTAEEGVTPTRVS